LDTVFSVTVSGHPSRGLLQATLAGPDWLSGGAYGVEGSAVALAVVTAASLILISLARRRGHVVLAFHLGDAARGSPGQPIATAVGH
jgi:hypothetical protein